MPSSDVKKNHSQVHEVYNEFFEELAIQKIGLTEHCKGDIELSPVLSLVALEMTYYSLLVGLGLSSLYVLHSEQQLRTSQYLALQERKYER